jgi:hypothetical protein
MLRQIGEKIGYAIGYVVGHTAAVIVVVPLMFQIEKRIRIYTDDVEVVRELSHRVIDIVVADSDNIMWHPFKSRDLVRKITDQEVNKWLYR